MKQCIIAIDGPMGSGKTTIGKLLHKKLILMHQILHGSTKGKMMKKIRIDYKGKVIYGEDLDSFSI